MCISLNAKMEYLDVTKYHVKIKKTVKNVFNIDHETSPSTGQMVEWGIFIMRYISPAQSSQYTPHSSPIRMRYGLSFMSTTSGLCNGTAMMYEICYIGLRYQGTQQRHIMRFSLVYQR